MPWSATASSAGSGTLFELIARNGRPVTIFWWSCDLMNRTRSRRTRTISAERSGDSRSHGEEDEPIREIHGIHRTIDAGGDIRLSTPLVPIPGRTLSFRAQLFSLRQRSHRSPRPDSGWVDGCQKDHQVSAGRRGGIRSGSRSRDRPVLISGTPTAFSDLAGVPRSPTGHPELMKTVLLRLRFLASRHHDEGRWRTREHTGFPAEDRSAARPQIPRERAVPRGHRPPSRSPGEKPSTPPPAPGTRIFRSAEGS